MDIEQAIGELRAQVKAKRFKAAKGLLAKEAQTSVLAEYCGRFRDRDYRRSASPPRTRNAACPAAGGCPRPRLAL